MIVAFFGVTCVGKSTVGKIIAEKLGWEFYDLDFEIRSFYNDTLTNIYDACFNRFEIDKKKGAVLSAILKKCGSNAIIGMSPIYYTKAYTTLFKKSNVFSIVLQDTPENIAYRLVYTDDNDIEIGNPDPDIKQDISDMKYFINMYKSAFSKIECHYHVNGKTAEEAASEIKSLIIDKILAGEDWRQGCVTHYN